MRSGAVGFHLPWLLTALLLGGCAGRIVPPSAPVDPVDVYLLDHGRHASLVLPRRQGGLVRYSYGEWGWYVEGRRHLLAGVSAMLWPTTGGLGRGVHEEIDSPHDLHRLAPEGLVGVYPLRAEAARVAALRRRLDAHFQKGGVTPTYSAEFDLEFVPYPRAYWLTHQSNLVVAQWLRRLGVEVKGLPWLSNWRIEAPPEAP
ncbi:hypothetical protein QLQ85_13285 [Halomonas sp. M4R5S39]|uniref:hypothetical protein n=1 Tax=Halomonas kalidii TaxID=3043293 RepID=UPI0024A9EE95|nr:hypothetical protein [Halomonas kalidii]MDI5985763.1 hypothetical protein [Halomonas kalidii]